MKIFLTAIFALFSGVLLLRSNLTPWTLVRQAEIAELDWQIEKLQAQLAGPRSGAWMYDPNYRTALEKKTFKGAPEQSNSWQGHRTF